MDIRLYRCIYENIIRYFKEGMIVVGIICFIEEIEEIESCLLGLVGRIVGVFGLVVVRFGFR